MSAESQPITPARFAEAIKDLPLSNLHAKAAELRNSIAHLKSSNAELEKYYTESGDVDCATYIAENEVVVEKFEERITLLKAEVEGRGMMWVEEEKNDGQASDTATNGVDESQPEVIGGGEHDSAREDVEVAEQNRTDEDEGGIHL